MLVEVHSLEPICLSHYVFFARIRDEIPNHVLGPFLFPKELLHPAHLLMELLMMTILDWFCCKMSSFLVSDMEICCILSRSDWLQECKWLSSGFFFPQVLVVFGTLLLCSSPFFGKVLSSCLHWQNA